MERSRRHSYYELFKACRLCGKGGGYKMPIYSDTPDPHRAEPELRHKIKDCCSIDARPDDKMPPLICELCVDKVNDFYEFREMCLATNIRVRSSLGLPPQSSDQHVSEDCILGVSGPLIYDSKRFDAPSSTPQPARVTFGVKEKHSKKKEQQQKKSKFEPEILPVGTKRRNTSAAAPVIPSKKSKLSVTTRKVEKSTPVAAPKTKKDVPAKAKKPLFVCEVCQVEYTKIAHLNSHMGLQHTPTIFSEKMGCVSCKEWFPSIRASDDHHKWHRTSSTFYQCDRCKAEFKLLTSYSRHFSSNQCIPEEIVPDIKCTKCRESFATKYLYDTHQCPNHRARKTEHCIYCRKSFVNQKSLEKHENMCQLANSSTSSPVNPNNPFLKGLKTIHVSMPKCDNILERIKKEPLDDDDTEPIYDVSVLCAVKTEIGEEEFHCNPLNADVKEEIEETNYGEPVNYDSSSDESESEDVNPFERKDKCTVESLSLIASREIFNSKYFKKSPRPNRIRVKMECLRRDAAASDVPYTDDQSMLEDQSMDTENLSNIVITNVTGGEVAPACEDLFDKVMGKSSECENKTVDHEAPAEDILTAEEDPNRVVSSVSSIKDNQFNSEEISEGIRDDNVVNSEDRAVPSEDIARVDAPETDQESPVEDQDVPSGPSEINKKDLVMIEDMESETSAKTLSTEAESVKTDLEIVSETNAANVNNDFETETSENISEALLETNVESAKNDFNTETSENITEVFVKTDAEGPNNDFRMEVVENTTETNVEGVKSDFETKMNESITEESLKTDAEDVNNDFRMDTSENIVKTNVECVNNDFETEMNESATESSVKMDADGVNDNFRMEIGENAVETNTEGVNSDFETEMNENAIEALLATDTDSVNSYFENVDGNAKNAANTLPVTNYDSSSETQVKSHNNSEGPNENIQNAHEGIEDSLKNENPVRILDQNPTMDADYVAEIFNEEVHYDEFPSVDHETTKTDIASENLTPVKGADKQSPTNNQGVIRTNPIYCKKDSAFRNGVLLDGESNKYEGGLPSERNITDLKRDQPVSETGEMDFDIDSILRDDPMSQECKSNTIADPQPSAEQPFEATAPADNCNGEVSDKEQQIMDTTEIKEGDKAAETENRSVLDSNSIDKLESDILDLVSDSGDDCNIIDSPEKLKAIEDQLLAGEDLLDDNISDEERLMNE